MVVAFITSQLPAVPLASDVRSLPADAEFAASGLRVASAIRLHRLLTVTTSLLRRQLGELGSGYRRAIEARLRALFELL